MIMLMYPRSIYNTSETEIKKPAVRTVVTITVYRLIVLFSRNAYFCTNMTYMITRTTAAVLTVPRFSASLPRL
ncbi:hypothetical protein DL95DRAFT_45848 [Leptodontidium sp. 2 PMI_412]|nr:hypothetical protein DL95DRAFT_45848 [Leptodontidium sp. 2 PMI_412]